MKRKLPPTDHYPTDEAVSQVLALLSKNESQTLYNLGVAYQYHGSPPDVYYSARYTEMGEELWQAIQAELRVALCTGRKPKPSVEDLVSGDVRDLIIGVLTAMASTLSVPLAVAVPATAIALKRGIASLCSATPGPPPRRTARQMLDTHAAAFKPKRGTRRPPKGTKGSA